MTATITPITDNALTRAWQNSEAPAVETPLFDAVKQRQDAINSRAAAIQQTSELFGNAADVMWPEGKVLELTDALEGEGWTALMQYVGASLMLMMEDTEYTSSFFPEDEVGSKNAVRNAELRSIGFAMACQSLPLLDQPEWIND